MELQGDWEPAAGAGLTSDKNFDSQLGWFPFPPSLAAPGTRRPCSAAVTATPAPPARQSQACAEFLQFLTTPAVQEQIIGAGAGLPANPAANGDLAVPGGAERGGGERGRPVHRRVLRHRAAHQPRPEPGQRGGEVVRQPGRYRDRASPRRSPRRDMTRSTAADAGLTGPGAADDTAAPGPGAVRRGGRLRRRRKLRKGAELSILLGPGLVLFLGFVIAPIVIGGVLQPLQLGRARPAPRFHRPAQLQRSRSATRRSFRPSSTP